MILSLSILAACTQDPGNARNFRVIFDHYRSAEHVMAVSFPPSLALLVMGDDHEADGSRSLMQDLSAFHMLIVDEGGTAIRKSLSEDVQNYTLRQGFEDLFRIQQGGGDIFIKILESEGFVNESVLMFGQEDGLVVLNLRGNISLDHFTALANNGTLESLSSLIELDF